MVDPQYAPNEAAVVAQPYNITLLSQRDVHLQIPINFVPSPGISLSAACFAHGVYEVNAIAQCLSNLLSIGYGRFEIDIYWDQQRRTWTFCPAEIPAPGPSETTVPATVTATSENGLTGGRASTYQTTTSSSSTSQSPSSTQLAARQVVETVSQVVTDSSGAVSYVRATVTLNPVTTSTHRPSIATTSVVPVSGESQFLLGPYTCSPDVNLELLIRLMYNYFSSTDNTLQAQIKYLIFNVHTASPADTPTLPGLAPNNASMPTQEDLIGAQFNANLSSYLYTPSILSSQRLDIRTSWGAVLNSSSPDASYFTVLENGQTPDGWPSESYIEFEKGKRLLLGLGRVDPQMRNYSQDLDEGLVFTSDMIASPQTNITFGSDGELTKGCIFDPLNNTVAASNSSNAVFSDIPASVSSDLMRLFNANLTIPSVSNLTACGISTILNSTLLNLTADTNPEPYLTFALSASIWSWASGEPLGDSAIASRMSGSSSSSSAENADSPLAFRCAVLDPKSEGRWHTAFCQAAYLGACRATANPYAWTFTEGRADRYDQLGDRCAANASFAVPRTALENAYLLRAAREAGHGRVFLNINSRNVESCWVAGVNATCPYVELEGQNTAAVVVPTVAAVIILFLTLLVLLVKCGANRSASRRKRVGGMGWDYEGVPS